MRTSRTTALALAALLIASLAGASPAAAQSRPRQMVFAVSVQPATVPIPSPIPPLPIPGTQPTFNLTTFMSDNPGAVTNRAITGLDGEALIGIDVQPRTGTLFGVDTDGDVYTINPMTGVATRRAAFTGMPAVRGNAAGFDFNPQVDRIRFTTNMRQNLRLNPETITPAIVDGDIRYASGDRNQTAMPSPVAAAYTNNFDQLARPTAQRATDLYVIDATQDVLTIQRPPNEGVLNTVGPLGVNVDDVTNIDIANAGDAYVTYGMRMFGTIDLVSGAIAGVGQVPTPGSRPIMGMAVADVQLARQNFDDDGEQIFVATPDNRLIEFSTLSPETSTNQLQLSGLGAGETVVGLDFRPATGQLYGVTQRGNVVLIDPEDGGTTRLSQSGTALTLETATVGFDFNPLVDRIRLVTSSGQNLRIEPESGTVAMTDGRVRFAAGDANAGESATATAAAYESNFASSAAAGATTELYVVDSRNGVLATQDPPNDGVLNTVGDLGLDGETVTAFDIAQSAGIPEEPDGAVNPLVGYATVADGAATRFGTIDLDSGAFAEIGQLDIPEGVSAMAIEVQVPRIFGETRFETAARLSRASFPADPGGPSSPRTTVFVATGFQFPDALAGGPAVSELGGPILLVDTTSLPPATAAELRRLNPDEIVVLGGNQAVADSVLAEMAGTVAPGTAISRAAGADRFQTAAQIATRFYDSPPVVYIARADTFPDALTGGAAAAFQNGPILLVGSDGPVDDDTQAALDDLDPDRIVILGGTQAVSAAVEAELAMTAPTEREDGENRFGTAAQVADTFPETATVRAYIAVADEFPDALAAVPVTALFTGPILLVASDGAVAPETREVLERLRPDQIVIVGGPVAIADEVARELEPLAGQ